MLAFLQPDISWVQINYICRPGNFLQCCNTLSTSLSLETMVSTNSAEPGARKLLVRQEQDPANLQRWISSTVIYPHLTTHSPLARFTPLLTHFLLPAWYSKMRWNSSTSCSDSGGTNTLSSRSSCSFGPTGPQRRTWRQAIRSLSGDLPLVPWNLFSKVHPALLFISTKCWIPNPILKAFGLEVRTRGATTRSWGVQTQCTQKWEADKRPTSHMLHRYLGCCWIPCTLLGTECLWPPHPKFPCRSLMANVMISG